MQRLRTLLLRRSRLLNTHSVSTSSTALLWNSNSNLNVNTNINVNVNESIRSFASHPNTKQSTKQSTPETTSTPLNLTLPSVTHSRHHEPPVAPHHQLSTLTSSILSAPLGSLYSFKPSHTKSNSHTSSNSNTHPHDVSDTVTQKVEYILRGYSALIPHSVMECSPRKQRYRTDIPLDPQSTDYQTWTELRSENHMTEYVTQMEALVDRLEKEGAHYQQMAEEYRLAQLSPTILPDNDTDNDNDSNTPPPTRKKISTAPKQTPTPSHPIQEQYSSPGPSTHIYELLLDAHSLITAPNTPFPSSSLSFLQSLSSRHTTILQRHDLDGHYQNTNPKTMPTCVTYNAILRSLSQLPFLPPSEYTVPSLTTMSLLQQQIRDQALVLAFQTFEQMNSSSSTTTHRNSYTYLYLLPILQTYIPPCRARGNMIRHYIEQACQEGVMTYDIMEYLHQTCAEEDGRDYADWINGWMARYGRSEGLEEFPRGWRRFVMKYSSKGIGKGVY